MRFKTHDGEYLCTPRQRGAQLETTTTIPLPENAEIFWLVPVKQGKGTVDSRRSGTLDWSSAEMKESFQDFIVAVKPAIDDKEALPEVLKEHSPLLGAFDADAVNDLLKVLANLDEDLLDTLLSEGYLRWKFDELDEESKQAMQDYFSKLLEMSKDMGFSFELEGKLKQMLFKGGDAGFAVLTNPRLEKQFVAWYLNSRLTPVPAFIPVFGEGIMDKEGIQLPEVFEQVSALSEKPYSPLPQSAQAEAAR